ncbi:MAG: phosphotransferase [Myxococcales bacterium]|nr:phosphotransferase [Myxococcales bacterium]
MRPYRPEELSTEWLQACLLMPPGTTLNSFRAEPFADGLGVFGRLVRLHLDWSGDDHSLPRTLVAKFPTESEGNLQLAVAMHFYRRECAFYRSAATDTPFRIPTILANESSDTHQFVLLMEDLDVQMCDQVAGGTQPQLERIIPSLAQHHAAFWGRSMPWAVRFDDPTFAAIVEGAYNAALPAALERFSAEFSSGMVATARRLDRQIGAQWRALSESGSTLVHGDFRLDNIGFSGNRVVSFDWQISGINVGAYDLGFLISQSVNPEVRRELDDTIVEAYHAALCAGGVADYSLEQCRRDYLRAVLACLVYPVILCGMLEVGNERGRQYAVLSLRRALSAIEELGADRYLL